MRTRILTVASVVAFSAGSALAADLPSIKEPPAPVPPPSFSWTGVYAGVNVGGGIGDADFANQVALTGGAVLGGLGLGYNWQWSPNLVLGIEVDADYRGPINPSWNGYGFVSSSDIGYIGTFRPRIGYAVTDHLLLYGTGGLAFGNVIAPKQYGALFLPGFAGVRQGYDDKALVGWTVGAGLEYAVTANWSVKLEYLYARLQHSAPRYWTAVSFFPAPIDARTVEDIVRLGVNYRFDWQPPAPIAARF
jgi:outer membrane immunogenic protein